MIRHDPGLPSAANVPDGLAFTCFLHIGTHKTGTTSLQRALCADEELFWANGIHIPQAGRFGGSGGHHNIAWELNGDERFDPARGSFADVLAEIAQRRAPRVCLSSEDFEYLYARPDALETLAAGIRGIGYRPIVIVYLRPQAGYLESLYAELVRHGLSLSFDAFFAAVLATGEFCFNERWRFRFDYAGLLDDFAAVFGPTHIIARPYDTGAADVVRDFLPLVEARDPRLVRHAARARRLNPGLRCADVLGLVERNARAGREVDGPRMTLGGLGLRGRFDPLGLAEIGLIVERFNAGNRRVYEDYGALVPCVGGQDLVADVACAVGLDPAGRNRKRAIRAQAARLRLGRAPASAPVSFGAVARARRGFAPEYARPALLEAVIAATAATVATAALTYGQSIGCTSLVEFGLLSCIVAASAAALLVLYALESRDVLIDNRFFSEWGARLSIVGYAGVGVYALVNGLLDVLLGRYAPDWISYPGAIDTVAAALILTALPPLRRRYLSRISMRPMIIGLRADRVYVAASYAALAAQVVHAVLAAWWLDTLIDVLVVVLACAKVRQIRNLPDDASVRVSV